MARASDAADPLDNAADPFDKCVDTAQTVQWHVDPEYALAENLPLIVETGPSRQCPATRTDLTKRQVNDKGKKTFDKICMRERGESSKTHSNVNVEIGGEVVSAFTPGGGHVSFSAYEYLPRDQHNGNKVLEINVQNHSECNIEVEWADPPLVFPSERRNDPNRAVPALRLPSTPRHNWNTPQVPHCEIGGIRPPLDKAGNKLTNILVRVLLLTFFC